MTSPTIVISGTGLFTPEQSISNQELVTSFNAFVASYNEQHQAAIDAGEIAALDHSSTDFITKASGIKNRFVLDKSGVLDPERLGPVISERDDDSLSIQAEMAVKAAQQALIAANKTAADIDMVIVACSNMQRAYPAISIEVQAALGIEGFAFDMNVACSSATFGIDTARNSLLSGQAKCVLMVNPEICSGHLEWRDRDCHFIFGDACTAVVIENIDSATSTDCYEIISSKLKTQFSNNIRNNFGFLNRCDESGIGSRDKLFRQNGRKVFKEVCPMVAAIITEHLNDNHLTSSDLKRMWLHQANLSMNELIAKRVLGRSPSPEEAPVILDQYANTSSAGSIIAFHLHHDNLSRGDIGVICSFGAGYSVGSILLKRC